MFLKSQPDTQPVLQHMNPQATSGHYPAQNTPKSHPEVDAALAEIRVFAGQMQEMTSLFRRGQTDMSRQMEMTTLRLDKAAETVAMGEAKVAAQIAAFERMTNEARRAAEEHERNMRDAAEHMRRAAAEFGRDSTNPLQTEVANISRLLGEAQSRITSASDGIVGAATAAAVAISAQGQEAIQQQSEKMTGLISSNMENAETRLKATTAALDQASGALSHRIKSAANAQDAKASAFQAAVKKLETINLNLNEDKTQSAAQDETTRRLEESALAINVAASKIIGAVIEMQNEKSTPRTNQEDAAFAAHKADVAAVISSIENALTRVTADRNEATTEVLVRMDQLQEVMQEALQKDSAEKTPVIAPVVISDLPALDVEREAMKRLTVGYRLMMRDVGKENQRLETLVGTLADSIKMLNDKAQSAPIPAIAVLATTSGNQEQGTAFEKLGSEKVSFQRLLVGFRLLMRDINSEAARLRTIIDGVAKSAVPQERVIIAEKPSVAEAKLEELAVTLGAVVAQLDEKVQILDQAEKAKPEIIHLALPAPQDIATLPRLDAEKDSLQRILVGFRLLLRDIGLETESYRTKIADIRQPDMLVLSPALEAEALAPLNATAERIAEGIAETLAQLEQRMTEPLSVLNTAVAESANILKLAHGVLSSPPQEGGTPATTGRGIRTNASSEPLSQAALVGAVAAMQRAASSIDSHIGHVDQLLITLKKGGALSSESLRDIVTGIDAATASLREEAGDFLAIGAALSRDMEAAAGIEEAEPQPRRIRSLANMKKRSA
jgi:hypothetical protein